jgi:hypothetical protein
MEEYLYSSTQDIYEDVLLTYLNDISLNKPTVYFYPESTNTAVIIDPRYSKLMEAVIRNFMHFMNPEGWNLKIVSYSGYETQIKRDFPNCIFEAIDENVIVKDATGTPNITIDTYNSILKSISFWEKQSEQVAIFQTDCLMFHMFPSYFTVYDFAGARYGGTACGPFYGGINGGFSLRKRDAMIDCIRNVSFQRMCHYNISVKNHPDVLNEDVFFTHACEILKKLVPDVFHRSLLSIECDYNPNTSIIHAWNKSFHSPKMTLELLKNSPLFSKYIQIQK